MNKEDNGKERKEDGRGDGKRERKKKIGKAERKG